MPRDLQLEKQREDIKAMRTASRYYRPASVTPAIFPTDPFEPISRVAKLARTPGLSFEERFTRFVDIAAPQLPANSPKFLLDWRQKMVDTLSPVLLNKYLPPMPKALAERIHKQ